jgi:hypothetical protein
MFKKFKMLLPLIVTIFAIITNSFSVQAADPQRIFFLSDRAAGNGIFFLSWM